MSRPLLKSELEETLAKVAGLLERSGFIDGSEERENEEGRARAGATPFPQVAPSQTGNVEPRIHKLRRGIVCGTDERGYPTPHDQSPVDLVLDASEGFIPLWRFGTTLRWCFDEIALATFENPRRLKDDVRRLVSKAVLAWGDAAPVKFKEQPESHDFRIVVRNVDSCSPFGCTLARAFFPDSGRHDLELFPKMFEQSEKEQVDTLTHEFGHVFGLRHFFANVSEQQWPSVIFGTHRPFSIMNYGQQSELTEDDRNDLKRLYDSVWSGRLTEINGTPFRLFSPYHEAGSLVAPRYFAAAAKSE